MYRLTEKHPITGKVECIQRLSDNAFIPLDPDNSDYAEFLKQQAEGVKVYAADETIPEGETT